MCAIANEAGVDIDLEILNEVYAEKGARQVEGSQISARRPLCSDDPHHSRLLVDAHDRCQATPYEEKPKKKKKAFTSYMHDARIHAASS